MSIFDKLKSGERMQEFFANYFERAGWTVEVVTQDPSLRDRKQGGLSRCGDGRPFEEGLSEKEKSGYNVFGATPGLAGMIAEERGSKVVTAADLEEAIARESRQGIVSGWHNIHGINVHCGYEAKQGGEGIPGIPKQEFSPERAAEVIRQAGGRSADVTGPHDENRLALILKKGKTAVSNPQDQQFTVDAGFIKECLGIRMETIAKHSENTVKALKPAVNRVRIVV